MPFPLTTHSLFSGELNTRGWRYKHSENNQKQRQLYLDMKTSLPEVCMAFSTVTTERDWLSLPRLSDLRSF